MKHESHTTSDSTAIAVIGMSCRFPGADNIDQFWNNLKNGIESVEILNDQDLRESGVTEEVFNHPNYVRSAPVLNNVEMFDAGFFGFSPGEAKILDPQRRLFLMCGWEVFEDAGYNPYSLDIPVAVYGSAGVTQYYNAKLCGNDEIYQTAGEQQILISNDKDHLPTHLSYKLNLKGPSINVNTACSSSLVAVHLARMSLLLGECDMAVAGGASVMVPHKAGYMYVEDSILSRDGHCRAFDEQGSGTLWGSGCGVVLLKRLEDALRDNDNIRAIIRGSAINNDGNEKVGYTAPSVEGQAEVVIQALASADLEPRDISYIEAHGTGTKLGDPIEVAALINVFDEFEQSDSHCLIGSVKPNIGHLGAAAGIASFIKSVLALEHKQIPPSINFETPNKKIDFSSSPFQVNNKLTNWTQDVRRLGVSSLAVGGTNCHIVMEEAPLRITQQPETKGPIALFLSARTNNALMQQASNLANYCLNKDNVALEDIAFTLQFGRNSFEKRAVILVENIGDAIVKLDRLSAGEDDAYCHIGNLNSFLFPPRIANTTLDSIKQWLNQEAVDLAQGDSTAGKRIALPTYPFEMQRYWIDFDRKQTSLSQEFKLNNKTGLPGEWFYEQSWQRKTLRPLIQEELVSGAQWLVFSNNNSFCNRLVQSLLDLGETVVVVTQGESFEKLGEGRYRLNPAHFAEYDSLVQHLQESFELPSRVLHLWTVESRNKDAHSVNLDTFRSTQFKGYYSVLNLVQSLNRHKFNSELSIKVLTSDMHDITGSEKNRPEKASIIGLVKVLQQEFQNITCQAIDLYLPTKNSDEESALLQQVQNEIRFDQADIICAFRNARRWVQSYERIEIAAQTSKRSPIKVGGTYLIYDGLVGIGLEVSKTLLTEYKATVLVLGDVSMPPQQEWDNWLTTHDPKEDISVKIGGFRELAELGGIFLAPMPQDNNLAELSTLIDKAEQQYGKFNGIIHCSGGSANGHVRAVNKASYELTERDFITVPYALMALDSVFEKRDLDFRLVMSSLGSILGGILFVSYGSSNCLAASYAEYSNAHKAYRWNVQCWDSWDIEWKIVDYKNTTLHDNITDRLRAIALTVEEGLDCFHRSLGYDSRYHITISSTDLQARIDKWVNKKTMEGFKADTSKAQKRHPRPALSTDFAEPINSLEKTLASAFEKLLDIDAVGRHDNFFELGGHSLLATQLITELRSTLNADMAISDVLESPTVEKLGLILQAESHVAVENEPV
ncbi:beta-ketoacyl synthase N-terminal-like domain-containing protein [Cellvibrio sp. ARAG 10.3]|uniref:type I polyketide synthase n=1 Tax=Cellvibrio sp. ARAG 10.3 TaxID=3451358 RepID=UPI003F4893EB